MYIIMILLYPVLYTLAWYFPKLKPLEVKYRHTGYYNALIFSFLEILLSASIQANYVLFVFFETHASCYENP